MSDLVCKADKRAYFAFVSQVIVKFPLFRDRNVQASSKLLLMCRLVCVGAGLQGLSASLS